MNTVLTHKDDPCFKSLLSHIVVIYYDEVCLCQSQAGGSQYEPIDDVLLKEKLVENKKKCQKE